MANRLSPGLRSCSIHARDLDPCVRMRALINHATSDHYSASWWLPVVPVIVRLSVCEVSPTAPIRDPASCTVRESVSDNRYSLCTLVCVWLVRLSMIFTRLGIYTSSRSLRVFVDLALVPCLGMPCLVCAGSRLSRARRTSRFPSVLGSRHLVFGCDKITNLIC